MNPDHVKNYYCYSRHDELRDRAKARAVWLNSLRGIGKGKK